MNVTREVILRPAACLHRWRGAALAFGIALVAGLGGRSGSPNPSVIIGLVFSAMAAATWIAAAFGDAERGYRALTGESD